MTEATAVPLIVLSTARDAVEAINSTLRRAGQPVHCTWLPALRDLGDALTQLNPQMLLQSAPMPDELEAAVRLRDKLAPGVPLLVLAAAPLDEAQMADAMLRGAHDVVTLAQPQRLQAVVQRELQAYRTARALEATLKTANVARSQLETVLQRSNDAIAQVQEGIVIEANPAWHELYGLVEGVVGQPVMDLFDESTHAALRGALAACQQGRWSDHALRANALLSDGTVLPLGITLALGEHEGEPCVRLVVPSRPREQLAAAAAALTARAEPGALLQRAELLRALAERLAKPSPGGMRCAALLRIDKFATLEREVGASASEEVLDEVARLLKESLHPKELVGRFGGTRLLALLERGNEQDINAWSERLLSRVQRHAMRINDKTVSVTCTIGLSVIPPAEPQLDAVLADALESARKGASRGGNQSVGSTRADNDSRVMSYDAVWVKHIKAALMENRFRLVQQPIASLQGDDPGMFDVLVRMIDPQGREVLPSEFMAAAARNDLMKNIDRWVVGASLSYAAQKKPECLFVRLSRDTARDDSFIDWLDNHLKSSRAEPRRLCFQVTEETGAAHIGEVKNLATELRRRKFRCALEGFGGGRNSGALLETMPLDFVKIHGTLVQGLTGDPQLQQRVRLLVEAAGKLRIQTVAERVEDANTMAVLWQIGVQYIQGYFVNQPEAVVLSAR
ncbi:MAG: EAL domain-containing protein [Gammaproteobacteria bacterium]|nr:EAL domain-containing protein [Gammaproteobacteria bacterium]